MKSQARLLAALLAVAAICSARPVLACNVPVFRYALERWRTDRFHLVLFHRGVLPDAEKALLKDLNDKLDAGGAAPNCDLTIIDLDRQGDEPERNWLKSTETVASPTLLVRTPRSAGYAATLWTGPFTKLAVADVLDSPVRREVLKRIRQGESGVIILLESADRQKNDAAERLIMGEIVRLSPELGSPVLAGNLTGQFANVSAPLPAAAVLFPERVAPLRFPPTYDPSGRSGPPLRIAFSILRVKRNDPAERLLVQMLLNSEDDVSDCPEPLVFPVFGRGRSLLALMGKGINTSMVHDYCNYLVGACQCEVKAANPGFELLMTADWDAIAEGKADEPKTSSNAGTNEHPTKPTVATTPEAQPGEPIPIPSPKHKASSRSETETDDDSDGTRRLWLLTGAGAGAVGVLFLALWLWKR